MKKQGRETIPITPSLRLVPYYPAYETTLPWYQDAELCHQVDNQNRIYDLSILKNMYEYLNIDGFPVFSVNSFNFFAYASCASA